MRKIREYGFIPMIAAAILALILMYHLTDKVKAATTYYNDTMLSDEAYEACVEIGTEYGVSPELLMAIAETESSGNPRAYNGGCQGLMQVSSKYHVKRMNRLGVSDITDEYGNILLATDYLLELFEEYEDVGMVLSVYHGESDAGRKYENGELSEYAEKILQRAAEITEVRDKFRNAVG